MVLVTKIPKIVDPLNKRSEHAPKKQQAPSTLNVLEAARSREPRIDIRVFHRRQPELGQTEYYAQFRFYSHMQPNFAVQANFDLGRESEREMDFQVGILCGAMAEKLNEVYLDNFDCEQAARTGSRQFGLLIAAWAAAPKISK
jgi:hypothetical protein